jgi:hypothetical protein
MTQFLPLTYRRAQSISVLWRDEAIPLSMMTGGKTASQTLVKNPSARGPLWGSRSWLKDGVKDRAGD